MNAYGVLYAWKDYSDNLFITVSMNATGKQISLACTTAKVTSDDLSCLPALAQVQTLRTATQ